VSRIEGTTRIVAARTALLLALLGTSACFSPGSAGAPGLGDLDRGLYEASGAVAPRHPVTGRPVLNVVPEAAEIRLARDFWRDHREEALARGLAVDPPGPRLERIRRVFGRLTAVAHRPQLPWEVHLVDDPTPNAFTAGGGLVVVLSGLFDSGMVDEHDDDALAVVLAHEIAHVAMLHPPTRVTWLGVGGVIASGTQDPYYQAAYTHEQEAEADRLSVLYLALAGIDPLAASRLWARVAERAPDSAARAGYRHDHPVGEERVAITREAGLAVERYRRRGRHPNHRAILADNVLYPRARDEGYRAGRGLTRAATAVVDGFRTHRRAARARDERRAAALAQARVRVIGTWYQPGPDGSPGLVVDVWNGAARPVAGMGISLAYWNRGNLIYMEDCRARVAIAPSSSATLHCPRQGVEADRIEPRVSEVSWR
jgi:hypothetical protein